MDLKIGESNKITDNLISCVSIHGFNLSCNYTLVVFRGALLVRFAS